MASRLIFGLAVLLSIQSSATATSLDYYRSALCDAQGSGFFLERYKVTKPIIDDKSCHQTPAKTSAMRMVDDIDSRCVVLAYTDYSCSSLVGSVPASGKCLASTKAKIGSWKAICNNTSTSPSNNLQTSYMPGELRRRDNRRLPKIRQQAESAINRTVTTTQSTSQAQVTRTVVASCITSHISSGISADVNATVTVATIPSADAALSSSVSFGYLIDTSLTSHATYTGSAAAIYTGTLSMTNATTAHPATVTYSGTANRNESATLYMGSASLQGAADGRVLLTVLSGMVVLLIVAIVL